MAPVPVVEKVPVNRLSLLLPTVKTLAPKVRVPAPLSAETRCARPLAFRVAAAAISTAVLLALPAAPSALATPMVSVPAATTVSPL